VSSTGAVDAFGALLADDVSWGDDDHPRECRNRSDVVATFTRLVSDGADGDIAELVKGAKGILCSLSVSWPQGMRRPGGRTTTTCTW
jgi:hypothetical protein